MYTMKANAIYKILGLRILELTRNGKSAHIKANGAAIHNQPLIADSFSAFMKIIHTKKELRTNSSFFF